MVCTGLLAPAPAGPALAFDPAKVFEGQKPTAMALWKYFFSAKKKGNEEDAIDALRYAAEQGSHAAQWKLGRMYQTGDGVKKDPKAAFSFYKQVVDSYGEARPGTPSLPPTPWSCSAVISGTVCPRRASRRIPTRRG